MNGANRRALAVTALVVLFGIGAYAFASQRSDWAYARQLDLARGTGWLALVGLVFTLAVTPLRSVLPHLGKWRRALGIGTALAAMVHASASLTGPLAGAFSALWTWPYLRAGAVALVLLMVLLLTSSSKVIKWLRVRQWKPLHRLVYVVALLVAQHVLMGPFASAGIALGMAAVLVLLLAARGISLIRQRR